MSYTMIYWLGVMAIVAVTAWLGAFINKYLQRPKTQPVRISTLSHQPINTLRNTASDLRLRKGM